MNVRLWLNMRILFLFNMEYGERICRFCLEKCATNFKAIEKSTHEILNVLLVTMVCFKSCYTSWILSKGKIKEYCVAEGINNTIPIRLNSVLQFTSGNDHELDVCKMKETGFPKKENETMKIQGEMCSLCLGKCENFKAVDGKTKHILDILFPKIDFSVIDGAMMCKNCEEVLVKYFDFKMLCLHNQNYIASFLNNKDGVKLDLKDVYLCKNVTSTSVPEDRTVCGLCIGLVKNCSAILLKDEEGDFMLEKIIEQCLPELDLSVIERSVICSSCRGTLEDCFNFVRNCLIIREKTKDCCGMPDMNSKGQIEHSSSLPFTIRNVTIGKVDCSLGDVIKVEEQFCEDMRIPAESEIGNIEVTVKLEQIFFDATEDAVKDVEDKNNSYMETNDQKINNVQQFTPKNMLAHAEESNEFSSIKTETENETKYKGNNLIEMEDQRFLLKEEIEIKTEELDFNRYEDGIVLPQSEVTRTYQCASCSFQAKFKSRLGRHLLKHKDPSEVTMNKCDSCSFQTKYKNSFKTHLLMHKDPSEVAMYKCDCCVYQTRNKDSLKKHLMVHKNLSEVKVYKCDSCLFETKRKGCLRRHLLKHKDPSEVTMHKCDFCSFQTKYKSYLKDHLLKHMDPSEVTMYKCDSCLYQTIHKTDLKKHLIVHKHPSEVTLCKCDSCSFETKHKSYLKDHLLKHKDPLEVIMHKCTSCSFQTKHKSSLKDHMLIHKDPSNVTMYKCYSCSFQTKYKSYLRDHLLRHRDPLEVAMYKCNFCSYQTRQKSHLKDHLLKHKNPSEVTAYTCDTCSFQTKYKSSFKSHLLTHKDPSEMTMFKCDTCSFQTRCKQYFKRHLRNHKHP